MNHEITDHNNHLQAGIMFLGAEFDIQFLSPAAARFFELQLSDAGKNLRDCLPKGNNTSGLFNNLQEVLKTLLPNEFAWKQKGEPESSVQLVPSLNNSNEICGIMVFTETAARSIEKKGWPKEKIRLLFDKMNSGILVVEIIYNDKGKAVDGLISMINKGYAELTGLPEEQIVGKNLSQLYPQFRVDLFQKLAHVAEYGETFESVEYVPQFDKHLKVSAYSFEKNQYIAIFEDVTETVRAQEAVIESEEKFSGLLKSMVAGIAIINVVPGENEKKIQVIKSVNPAFESVTGLRNDDILGKSLRNVLDEAGIHANPQLFEPENSGNTFETEIFWPEKDSYLRLVIFPIKRGQMALTIQDISKEKHEMRAKQHLASIVESTEDAIYSISFDGTILSWNKGAESLYGYKSYEIVGKNISMLSVDEKDYEIHKKLIDRVKAGTLVKNLEITQKTRSGAEVPVSLTKSPIKNEQNEVVAISDIVKDISQIKQRELELIEARQKSEHAASLKTLFLQNVSHEIRTPMNSIIGFTDLLKQRITNENDRSFMNAIEESGEQLIHLIDDILDVSRIESNQLLVTKSDFNVSYLMLQIKEQFEGVKKNMNKDHLDLRLILPEQPGDEYIYSDDYRLRQILTNLLSNAIKYTEKGYVEFGYSRDKRYLRFFVKDTGVGIRKEYLSQIFERFERANINTKKIFAGTGLGLSIAKGLAEKLGGAIWCESEEDVGSSFFFTIPYISRRNMEISEETQKEELLQEIPDFSGKTILIAEDDQFSFQLMQAMLAETRANVLHAEDGGKAVELFRKSKIDLALLDIRLPVKNGFEILKTIREHNKNLPVVAQTAFAMTEDRKVILESGFDGFLVKPVTSIKLYRIIKSMLHIDSKN